MGFLLGEKGFTITSRKDFTLTVDKKEENSRETTNALREALIGVKDLRHEAFLLFNAVPEPYLENLVAHLRILTDLTKINNLH